MAQSKGLWTELPATRWASSDGLAINIGAPLQGEKEVLAAQLADVKAQQHKLLMKANMKQNSLQCKIDSLEYAAKEREKKHESTVKELMERLEKAEQKSVPEMDIAGAPPAGDSPTSTQ